MIIAMLAAAVGLYPPTDVLPPGFKPPNWYKKPTDQDINAVWPRKALGLGIGGVAMVDCRVNIHGGAEDCRALSEKPEGEDFGAAAVLLGPQFLFRPATSNGAPIPWRVVIPIRFQNAPATARFDETTTKVAILDRPRWTAAPSFADVGAVYPKAGGGGSGYVAFHCDITASGGLTECVTIREEPTGKGYASAAKRLIGKFRTTPGPDKRTHYVVNLAIRLTDPAGDEFRRKHIGEPTWVTQIDPERTQRLYPPEAAAKGVKTGLGVTSCEVDAEGSLTNCAPVRGDPDGMGFDIAAASVAEVLKINPWTQEGGPVDGARIQLPIRFNLAAPAQAQK